MLQIKRTAYKSAQLPYFLRATQEKDLDNMLVVSGKKGGGKSNLSVVVLCDYAQLFGFKCRRCGYMWFYRGKMYNLTDGYGEVCAVCGEMTSLGVNPKRLEIEDLNKYLTYGEDVYEKVMKIESYSPVIPDEAMNFAMGEDWMYKKNKDTKKLFGQCRTKHLIFLMCIPKFDWFQSKYRDDMATAWLRIIRRGRVVMGIPDENEVDDAWHLKEFQAQLGHYNMLTTDGELDVRIGKLKSRWPCYYDSFQIPMAHPAVFAKYRLLRDHFVFGRDNAVKSYDVHKLIVYNLYTNWRVFMESNMKRQHPTYRSISEMLFKDPSQPKPVMHQQSVAKCVDEMQKWFDSKGIKAAATPIE